MVYILVYTRKLVIISIHPHPPLLTTDTTQQNRTDYYRRDQDYLIVNR